MHSPEHCEQPCSLQCFAEHWCCLSPSFWLYIRPAAPWDAQEDLSLINAPAVLYGPINREWESHNGGILAVHKAIVAPCGRADGLLLTRQHLRLSRANSANLCCQHNARRRDGRRGRGDPQGLSVPWAVPASLPPGTWPSNCHHPYVTSAVLLCCDSISLPRLQDLSNEAVVN